MSGDQGPTSLTGDDGVAVVGLGRMGRPMARNLRAAGFRVVGCDVSADARAAAEEDGIETVDNVAAASATTALTLLVVGFDEQVLDAVVGDAGALEGAAPGHVVAVCSSVEPDTVRRAEELATTRGVLVLDAPVCRGEPAAEDGSLLVMCGGDEAVVRRVAPALDAIATDVFHLGATGAGQVGKMLNNYLLWTAVVADQEALRLGGRLGVDLEALRGALLLSSGNNWALETWTRARPMPWAEEDMRVLTQYAERAGLDLPGVSLVGREIARVKQLKAAAGGPASSMDDFVRAHP